MNPFNALLLFFFTFIALQEKVKDAFDTAIWDALLSQQQSIKKPLWRRLFCLAW